MLPAAIASRVTRCHHSKIYPESSTDAGLPRFGRLMVPFWHLRLRRGVPAHRAVVRWTEMLWPAFVRRRG